MLKVFIKSNSIQTTLSKYLNIFYCSIIYQILCISDLTETVQPKVRKEEPKKKTKKTAGNMILNSCWNKHISWQYNIISTKLGFG